MKDLEALSWPLGISTGSTGRLPALTGEQWYLVINLIKLSWLVAKAGPQGSSFYSQNEGISILIHVRVWEMYTVLYPALDNGIMHTGIVLTARVLCYVSSSCLLNQLTVLACNYFLINYFFI